MIPCAYYCVANEGHFLGLVALLNSLRLTGNDAPLLVTDCGLTPAQRQRLEPHVTLLEPEGTWESPHLAKWMAPLTHPAEVALILDVDVIVLRSLEPLVRTAEKRPFAFADPLWHRFDEDWGRLLDLDSVRRGTYFNAGVIGLPAHRAAELLPIVAAAHLRIDASDMWITGGKSGAPFYFGDQDVWNAVFSARLPADELLVFEQRLAVHPPFPRLRLHNAAKLDCRYPDGATPFFLHHVGDKPWLMPTRPNIYSRLMTRLLLGEDVTLQLDSRELPSRLRETVGGDVGRIYAMAHAGVYGMRGRLGVRRRLRRSSGVPRPTYSALEPRSHRVDPDTMAREA